MRRIGSLAIALAATVALGAGTASANNGGGTYPPDPGTTGISVDKPVVETGDTITVSAHGLCFPGTVVFELAGSSTVGLLLSPPVNVSANGTASYTFTVPGPASQWYVGWAKQPACQIELNTPVQVVDPGTNPPPPPPPPPPPGGTIGAPDSIIATASLTVNGSNLCPGQNATFTLTGPSNKTSTVMAASDGTAVVQFNGLTVGNYTVTITQACGTNVSKSIKVEKAPDTVTPAVDPTTQTPAVASQTPVVATPAAATPAAVSPAAITPAVVAPAAPVAVGSASAGAGNLPTTGSDPANVLQIAAFALAAGLGMVMVATFRRRTKQAATISAS